MKLLTTIVALLSVSSASAAGWGRPQGQQHLSNFQGSTTTKETARSKAAVNKALSKKQEGPLVTRGGDKFRDFQNAAKIQLWKRIGDIGNVATIVLSVYLLVESLKFMGNNQLTCTYGELGGGSYPCTPEKEVDSMLDDCYVCDAFCTSRRESPTWNSHMTSVYVDLLMSVGIYFLRERRTTELKSLGLNDYFLNGQKIAATAGHGAAHWFLSFLMTEEFTGFGPAGLSVLLGVILSAFLISPEIMWKLKTSVGYATEEYSLASVADKQTHETHTKRVNHLGSFLAPFVMSQGMLALATSKMASEDTSPIGILVFGAAAAMFFDAGSPTTIPRIYAIGAAILMTIVSVLFVPANGPDDFGPGFILIFTSAYVYSALTQLFLWEEKKKFDLQDATSYAFNSWLTSLLTTCVGWMLALNCTSLIKVGGHMLYDLSIPISYFLLYFVARKFKVKEN